jgi:threonine/homoserine/homoserine lactone efflux protein
VITTGRLLAYLGTVFALFLAPGPSVVFVVSRSVALGWLSGLTAVAGNTLGLATQLVVVLGPGLADNATLSRSLKIAGAAYLIYLGLRAIRGRRDAGAAMAQGDVGPGNRGRLLRQGWVVGVTNPKGLITYTSIAPDAIHRAHGDVTLALAVLGLVAVLVAMLCDGAWALASGTVRTWLGGSPRRLDALNAGGGVLMIGFGIALAIIAVA